MVLSLGRNRQALLLAKMLRYRSHRTYAVVLTAPIYVSSTTFIMFMFVVSLWCGLHCGPSKYQGHNCHCLAYNNIDLVCVFFLRAQNRLLSKSTFVVPVPIHLSFFIVSYRYLYHYLFVVEMTQWIGTLLY